MSAGSGRRTAARCSRRSRRRSPPSPARRSRSRAPGAPIPASMRWARSPISTLPATGRPTPCATRSTPTSGRRRSPSFRRDAVAPDFDARFSAVRRHYLYRLLDRRAPPVARPRPRLVGRPAPRPRGHARGRPGARRPARFHHLPLVRVPGEVAGEDPRPARRRRAPATRSWSSPRRAPSCTTRCARWSAR